LSGSGLLHHGFKFWCHLALLAVNGSMSISRQHAQTAASHTHHSKSDANPME